MIVEHFILILILVFTSQPGKDFDDYIGLKNTSFTSILQGQNHTIILGFVLLAIMLSVLVMVLNNLLATKSYEQAKEQTISKQVISAFIGLTRTFLAFPIGIYLSISFTNLQNTTDSSAFYLILFTLIPILFVYGLSLIVSYRMTQMPVPTPSFFWNCIYSKNLYIREAMKMLLVLSDSFVPALRENKFFIIAYFLLVCAVYAYLNFKRCFFYDHLVDRFQMYCLRAVLSIGYAGLIRVIFELQLLEIIIFYPIILFVSIHLFNYFEQQRRRTNFDKIENISTLPMGVIQQIILQIIQMIDRQSLDDLRELQNILYRHRLGCFDHLCVCNMYYITVVENFKDELRLKDQQENMRERNIQDYENENMIQITTQKDDNIQDMLGSEATQNQQSRDSLPTDRHHLDQRSIGAGMIEIEMGSENIESPVKFKRSNQGLEFDLGPRRKSRVQIYEPNPSRSQDEPVITLGPSRLDPDFEQELEIEGEQLRSEKTKDISIESNSTPMVRELEAQLKGSVKNVSQIVSKFKQSFRRAADDFQATSEQERLENFTFVFDNNHIASNLTFDDFFKDVSSLESANKRIYDANNSQQQSVRTILEIQQMKFENEKAARRYFFIWLIEKMFKQYEGSQNQMAANRNIEFELLYINFINQNLQKHFLAIFQMLRIHQSRTNLKFFDRLLFGVSEQIILQEAISNFKNYFGGFDYSLFIDGNRQAIELDTNYEKATNQILDFWQKFKGNEVKIQPIIDLGVKISKRIYQIKKVTRRQEETYAIRKDLGKYQLYAMFHLNMLYDPNTFNQMALYLKNSLVFKTRKFLGNDQGVNEDSRAQVQQEMMDEKGICIAEGWNSKGQKGSLKFVFGNKTFCEMFKSTQLLLPGKEISMIMPSEIGFWHGEMINRFYLENKPNILGNLIIQFAKTFEGFIIPIKMRVNFYYHPEFKYSFFTQFEKINHMNMFNEEQTKIPCDDCMFIIVDENLGIQEYSENVLSILGISKYRFNMFEENTGEKLKITDLFVELQASLMKEFGESVLPLAKDLSLVNKMIRCKKYNQEEGVFSQTETFPCILSYIQQPIVSDFYNTRLNVFIVIPLSRHPDYEGLASSHFYQLNKIGIQSAQYIRNTLANQEEIEKREEIQQIIESIGSEELSGLKDMMSTSSQSSNTSSDSTGLGSAFFAKNLLFQNQAPKVIKINLALVLTMIIAFLIINIYNLAIFLNKHSYIKGRFDTYSYISQRNARLRASLLDMKMIQQITQNVSKYNSKDFSSIVDLNTDRLTFYQEDLQYNLHEISTNADAFNQFMMMNQDFYSFDLQFNGITFITEQGVIYTQNVSYKHGINLFLSYADDLDINQFIAQKPQLNVENFYKSKFGKGLNRGLTDLEEALFFLFENGLYKMSELGQQQSFMLTEVSSRQTNDGQLALNIGTFVSIGIVTLIGIIIFPLISKVIERQYSVIRFFNYLDVGSIEKILETGKTFQKQLQIKIGKSTAIHDANMSEGEDDDGYQSGNGENRDSHKRQPDKKRQSSRARVFSFDQERSAYSQQERQMNKRISNRKMDSQFLRIENSKSVESKFKGKGLKPEDRVLSKGKNIMSRIEEEIERKEQRDKEREYNSNSRYYGELNSPQSSNYNTKENKRRKNKDPAKIDKEVHHSSISSAVSKKALKGKNKHAVNYQLNKDIFEDEKNNQTDEEQYYKAGSQGNKYRDKGQRSTAMKMKDFSNEQNQQNNNDKQQMNLGSVGEKKIKKRNGNRTSSQEESSSEDENIQKQDQVLHSGKEKRGRRESMIDHGGKNEKILTNQGNLDGSKSKQIFAQIQKLTFQKRFKICFLLGVLIVYLNASLLVSFYQTQIVFANDKDSNQRMSKFYQREECAYNLLLFMREKIIRNQSIPIDIYLDSENLIKTPAIDYYITKCYQNEYEIQYMRSNMPVYLEKCSQDLEGIENSGLCSLTYQKFNKDEKKAKTCEEAYNGILRKGMGNAMYYIIGYIQQMNFNLQSPKNQTQEYLNQLLNQQQYHELSDLILYYLAESFDFLQYTVIEAGQVYFNQTKQNYLLSFGIFMSVTIIVTLIGGILAFKKAKQSILDIQNMLILLPLDQIDPVQRSNIEKYLNK